MLVWFNRDAAAGHVGCPRSSRSSIGMDRVARRDLISNVTIFGGCAVIERGEMDASEIGALDLTARMVRRPRSEVLQ